MPTARTREVYATGIATRFGMDFAPDKTLWFTDNQVDGMGDDQPPGELNQITKQGPDFGFPWYGGAAAVRTVEYKDDKVPADVVRRRRKLPPHAADLGMIVYKGKQFPEKYRGGIFTAEHGSWNRTTPIGARVMYVPINKDGTAGKPSLRRGLADEGGEYLGRRSTSRLCPTARCSSPDDTAGAIYRISYEK